MLFYFTKVYSLFGFFCWFCYKFKYQCAINMKFNNDFVTFSNTYLYTTTLAGLFLANLIVKGGSNHLNYIWNSKRNH